MSRICCSQCGEVGHNKRNQTKCRVNVERNSLRTRAPLSVPVANPSPVRAQVIDVAFNLVRRHLEDARDKMTDLAQYLMTGPTEQQDSLQYILTGVEKVQKICDELTNALQNDTRNVVDPSTTLTRLRAGAGILNHLIRAISNAQCPGIVIRHENRRVKLILETLRPSCSKFLKELSVVHDATVTISDTECDCPICFETVAKPEAIYTTCGHGFCVTCIKGLATSVSKATKETKPSCPMCRREITELKTRSQNICNEIKTHLTGL